MTLALLLVVRVVIQHALDIVLLFDNDRHCSRINNELFLAEGHFWLDLGLNLDLLNFLDFLDSLDFLDLRGNLVLKDRVDHLRKLIVKADHYFLCDGDSVVVLGAGRPCGRHDRPNRRGYPRGTVLLDYALAVGCQLLFDVAEVL